MGHRNTWTLLRQFPSISSEALPVLEALVNQLRREGWSTHDVFGIHLAVEEALVNAITHGNSSEADKTVSVYFQVNADRLIVEVTDQGLGFNPRTVPDPTRGDRLSQPHGRGVMLMRALMDRVEYLGRGNHVVLEKHRGGCDLSESVALELALPAAAACYSTLS